MNDDLPPMPTSIDDLAAYALDAHDPADDLAIAAHLDATPGAARWERTLRDAAGEYAAALSTEVAPPDDLRARVLATARRRRPPAAVRAGATPLDVHRVELSRAILLLRALGPADWERPVDPPEFAGWTVHDVAVHLVANESLLADQLGVPVAGIPETATDNEGRTATARARHRGRPPAEAVDELE
ncbi:MAG TPA: maleylpyruvate isomerase N-terminal domain-containing protein, partial [Acidimicrobiales bacterium]|nr:maleylpyruvate isomerase N-terminal domain-containing protein [Acidimicrobiales bacterium]